MKSQAKRLEGERQVEYDEMLDLLSPPRHDEK